ncbi:MAG: hypothetical protein FE834_05365 [Gammaproteobacteria bacterium]|nr:hypothetical protein [Gammaproteobacteria bacterium]
MVVTENLSKKAGNNQWYELQASPSDEFNACFEKEKLFWMDMSNRGRFAYSNTKIYCNDKGFVMTGASLPYLCAILNSDIVTWAMKNIASTTGMGLMQWKKFSVERLPILQISDNAQKPFIDLMSKIIKAKNKNQRTTTFEEKINVMVYQLYKITDDEISLISDSLS